MATYLQNLLLWSHQNDMRLNVTKTKEMVFGPWQRFNNDLLSTSSGQIERVTQFKLLGLYVDSSMLWNMHVDYITKKAAQRLYFLKTLKRSRLSSQHLLHYYVAAIRPVLEYCSPVWSHNLPQYLSQQIESIQKRAIHIIFGATYRMPYLLALSYADLSSLQHRRDTQARQLFETILDPASSIHSLLPPPRDQTVISRLRNPHRYPITIGRTKNINPL